MATKPVAGQKKPGQKFDVYQMVTDRIIKALKTGTIPWKKTWQGFGLAQNYVTKHTYSGINALLTNLSPYRIPYFVTLKQANELGGKIIKGSKGLPIIFWTTVYRDDLGTYYSEEEAQNHPDLEEVVFTQYYRVFNIEDVEGVIFDLPFRDDLPRYDTCEQMIDFMPDPPDIKYGGNQAFYCPPTDEIQVPMIGQFESPEAYYATLFHEIIHSTGHSKRLAREELMEKTKFDSLEYSQEELTAEIGAAFLCSTAGIETVETFENTASYIQGWLTKLQDDNRFIFKAARDARKAVEYITQI